MSKAEDVLQMNNRQDLLNKLALGFTEYMMQTGYFCTCLNCHNWNDKQEICKLYNQRPPARVIVSGCESHEDVPF